MHNLAVMLQDGTPLSHWLLNPNHEGETPLHSKEKIMANKTTFEMQARNPRTITIAGSFRPNGTSAIDNTLNTGKGFSVARTNQGVFTITLDEVYPGLISALATIQMASATDLVPQWGAIDVSSAKTLVLNTNAVATPTDIADNASNRVHFTLLLRNTNALT